MPRTFAYRPVPASPPPPPISWATRLATLLGPVVLALAAAVPAQNLGFEDNLEGWRLIRATGGLRHEFDTKTKSEGKQSLHLTKSGRFGMDNLHRDFTGLKPGDKFRISAVIKTRGLRNGWFKCFFHDASGKSIGYTEKRLLADEDWKRITLEKEIPTGATRARVMFLVAMPGDIWLDDIQVGGGSGSAAAKPDVPQKPLPKRTQAWLDRQAVAVDALDFDADDKDLQRLKRILGDARIVQLGENSHGDGEAFRAKARLARFLHAEMGFEIIAFESGLYECEAANEIFRSGKAKSAATASVFGIWRVKQTLPLFDYIAKTAKSKRPLRITGFDTRGSGTLAPRFVEELLSVLEQAGTAIPATESAALLAINKKLSASPYKPKDAERTAAIKALEAVRNAFEANRATLTKAHDARQVDLWSRCLQNFVEREKFEYSKNTPSGKSPSTSVNLRDEQMARNFRWLADTRYKGKKIITWAATFHQAHNLKLVSIDGNQDFYKNTRGMGEYLHEWYGKQLFTIGFCAFEGEAGIFAPKFAVTRPQENSFEDQMARYGKPYLLVPLRGMSPFQSRMLCAPMAYGRNTSAPWPRVLDALFFIREMTSTEFMGK